MAVDSRISAFTAQPSSDPSEDIAAWRVVNDQIGQRFGGDLPVGVTVETSQFIARDGASVGVRIYRMRSGTPPTNSLQTAVLYFHGGGWVVGSALGSECIAAQLAHELDAVVISVDYRMAPEYRFPTPIDDCEDALSWVKQSVVKLSIGADAIVLAGDSAGAHLALSLAYRAHDAGNSVQGVMAFYPCIDPSCNSDSMLRLQAKQPLTRQRMLWFWDQFLGGAKSAGDSTPWLRPNLSGLPPTWIMTASEDPLSSEGQQFAARLASADVRVGTELHPGMLHGFMRWRTLVPNGGQAVAAASQWMRIAAQLP